MEFDKINLKVILKYKGTIIDKIIMKINMEGYSHYQISRLVKL